MLKMVAMTLFAINLMIGCTAGPIKTNPLPYLGEPEKAAEVFVIREDTIYGGAFSSFIMVDDKEVFGIKYGEYTKFKLSSGKHTLGVKTYALFGIPVIDTIEIDLAPKSKNHYFLSKSFQSATIKRLQPQEGEALISKTTYIPFD